MLLDQLDRLAHLVQLLWTDIRAMGEPKVQQRPFPPKVLLGERAAFLVEQRERSANRRATDFLIGRLFA
jgi:hypothetical protein